MRAYRVEEDWKCTKTGIVWAGTAEEAKAKWLGGAGSDDDVLTEGEDAEPRGLRTRRLPEEDTDD